MTWKRLNLGSLTGYKDVSGEYLIIRLYESEPKFRLFKGENFVDDFVFHSES